MVLPFRPVCELGPFEGPANGKPPALPEVIDSYPDTVRKKMKQLEGKRPRRQKRGKKR